MKRTLWVLAALAALIAPASAADNYQATEGAGKFFGCKDVAGVCFPEWIPVDSTGALFGVIANPIFVVFASAQPVTGPLTDAQLRAVPVPVSGTFWQATQPVSGTFWQATQPVSGAINSFVDGAYITDGTKADTAWSLSGSGSSIAINKAVALALGSIGDVAWVSGNGSAIALLKNIAVGIAAGAFIDESTFTEGTSSIIGMGCYFKTSPTALSTTQIGGVACTSRRGMFTNLDTVGGTAVDTNSGNKSGGTQRFVNATDQPSLPAAGQGANGATAPGSSTEAGCVAQNAEATAVTNGQMGGIACDLTKKPIVLLYANPENSLNGQITAAMTGTTSTAVTGMGAQGGVFRVYITGCTISNSHATVGTMVNLQDGSGGAVLWQFPAAPAYGGAIMPLPTPIKTTANTGLFAVNATTGASTFVSCTGYKGI